MANGALIPSLQLFLLCDFPLAAACAFTVAAFAFLIGQLSYFGYFNSIPNVGIVGELFALGEIKSQIAFQILGPKQYLLLGLMGCSLIAGYAFKRTLPPKLPMANRFFAALFLIFAAKIAWPIFGTELSRYFFQDSIDCVRAYGYTPIYLSQLAHKLSGVHATKLPVPGKLNGPARLTKPPGGPPRRWNAIFVQGRILGRSGPGLPGG